MIDIFEEVELLTITYKSEHLINQCLSNINDDFRITVVENSNNENFKKEIERRKNTKCILSGKNLGFGSAFNLGAKSIRKKYIFHFNPDAVINDEIIFNIKLERWPSGLRRTLGKRVKGKIFHGFESHSLRQLKIIE